MKSPIQGPDIQSVLIVGAGPTGLTLAAVLARSGVVARIIDKALTPPNDRSRAIVIQARTLEIFRDLGLDEDLLRGALVVDSATVVLPSGKQASLRFRAEWIPSRFNRITSLPQDETERVLTDGLRTYDVSVERGCALEALVDDSAGVECNLRRADGSLEQTRFDWVVGADGAHSAVRHAAGLSFDGETYADEAMLGDVDIDWAYTDGEILGFPGSAGFVLAFPLPGVHRFRIIMIRPATAAPEIRMLSQTDFMASLVSMMPKHYPPPRLMSARWLTRYRLHRRGVAEYKKGHVFVAGDAAHIHSPVGAQGMNTGIQDAYNLGWKLALVAQGKAPAWILDSYHQERFPVGQKLLRGTDAMFGFLARGGPFARALRRVMPMIGIRLITTGRIGRTMSRLVSQTAIRYRVSSLVSDGVHSNELPKESPRAGDRLPDIQMETGAWLHDRLRTSAHVILVFGERNAPTISVQIAAIGERFSELVRVEKLHSTGALACFSNAAGAVYLIRPDKHIGFRGTLADVSQLADILGERLMHAVREVKLV